MYSNIDFTLSLFVRQIIFRRHDSVILSAAKDLVLIVAFILGLLDFTSVILSAAKDLVPNGHVMLLAILHTLQLGLIDSNKGAFCYFS